MDKPFLKTKEAKQLYNISRQTLDRRAEEGKINKYRFGKNGRSVYWKKSEIEQLFTPNN